VWTDHAAVEKQINNTFRTISDAPTTGATDNNNTDPLLYNAVLEVHKGQYKTKLTKHVFHNLAKST